MKIIIGASKNNNLGSKLIQWWENSKYSHVYIRWHLHTQDREIIYQASHGMVHFLEFSNFKKHNKIVTEISLEITTEQFVKLTQKCIDYAGKPYSKLELLQIWLSDVSDSKVKVKDRKGFICSELLGALLVELNITFQKPLYLLTPKDIMEALEANYGKNHTQ